MLRILTLNTWHGHIPRGFLRFRPIEPTGHKNRRIAAVCEGVRSIDPDVIFFQECHPQPAFSGQLARELGYAVVSKICNAGIQLFGRGLPIGIGHGEGLAILAKPGLGLRSLGACRLSGIGLTSRYASLQISQMRFAIAGEVTVRGRGLVLVTSHLRYAYPSMDTFRDAWADLRARGTVGDAPSEMLVRTVRYYLRMRDAELGRLEAWVHRWIRQGRPVIVGADLNLDPRAEQTLRFADRLGLVNVLPMVNDRAITWDPQGNPNVAFSTVDHHPDGKPKSVPEQLYAHYDSIPQCPDHLFVGPALGRTAVRDAGVALDRAYAGVYASDHYGICAEVRLG